jgi:Ecdysteroid kinase-like family
VPHASSEPVLDAGCIDHGWLRDHLGWPLDGDEPITAKSISHSDGAMGSVQRVTCAGRSIIFKSSPEDPEAMGGLVARSGLMEREVRSYRFFEGRGRGAPKVAPDLYWSALGPDGRGALAVEDLGAPAGLGDVMAPGLGLAQARAAVRCLAIVHSSLATTGGDALAPPYPWLYSASSAGLFEWLRLGRADLARVTAACVPGGVPETTLERILDVDVEAVTARSHAGANCVSLCHGDAWAGNILFTPRGAPPESQAALLIDWQFTMWGNPLSDVALLLVSSLTPASRAAWQEELLAHYHSTLTAQRALDYTLDACRDDLRRAEPFAALVALATLEDYTRGMRPQQLSRFAATAAAFVDRVAALG